MQSNVLTDYYKLTKKRPREVSPKDNKNKLAKLSSDNTKILRVPTTTQQNAVVKFNQKGPLSPKKNTIKNNSMKMLLKNKKKLSDLKSALEGINESTNKLTELRKQNNNIKTKNVSQFYSPTKNNDKEEDNIFNSPTKIQDIKTPAFKRYNHLTTTTTTTKKEPQQLETAQQQKPAEQLLPLPWRFRQLNEIFVAIESIIWILSNRQELITFPKVKTSVFELIRTNLTKTHLGQILTIYPNVYNFTMEKIQNKNELLFNNNVTRNFVQRKIEFKQKLIKFLLDKHELFLSSLDPKIIIPDHDNKITRWHPKFPIDTIIIKPQELPQDNLSKISTAKDLISKAQHLLSNEKVKIAITTRIDITTKIDTNNKNSNNNKVNVKALKGISQGLIDKIRQRESNKLLNSMTESEEELKKKKMKSKLPEFIQIIRNTFIQEKKAAINIDILIQRIIHSLNNSFNQVQVNSHLELLLSLLPNWIQRHQLTQGEYIKINQTIDLNDLIKQLK